MVKEHEKNLLYIFSEPRKHRWNESRKGNSKGMKLKAIFLMRMKKSIGSTGKLASTKVNVTSIDAELNG